MKFVFSTENYTGSVDDLRLHIRYTNTHGEACSVTVSQPIAYNEAKKQYAFIFDGLLAAELRSVVAVQIRSGNTPLS
ncbi:MAG: hypothetical protein IKM59_03550 [Oscillospiraceae bacterium]|nr:hypothetical protein [Oscillospiraceae bacterium]